MKDLEKVSFAVGMNDETAGWLNNQHGRMEKGARLLVDIAVSIGSVLIEASLQKCNSCTFADWLENSVSFSKRTAYNYMNLYSYRQEISGAKSLTEAYKLIETKEGQRKQGEEQAAAQRVDNYRKTGVKPEGWRRGTDDRLTASERLAAIEKIAKADAAESAERATQAAAAAEAEIKRLSREADELSRNSGNADALIGRMADAAARRAEFKEKIRLSDDGKRDPFQDAIIDYLESLEDDNRRIEACYNIIKVCKRIANELQGVK